jgi:hypothetical protein
LRAVDRFAATQRLQAQDEVGGGTRAAALRHLIAHARQFIDAGLGRVACRIDRRDQAEFELANQGLEFVG